LLEPVVRYFDIRRPVLGGTASEFFLFSGVAAGTVGRWVLSVFDSGPVNWQALVAGLVASIVTFPTIYTNAGLKDADKTFVKWCVAFQNGYFWPVVLEQVGKTIGHS
jgi:hypothetical protein